jgi:hypothetical protein
MCCCGSSLAIAQAIAQVKQDELKAAHDLDQGPADLAGLEVGREGQFTVWHLLAGWLRLARVRHDNA